MKAVKLIAAIATAVVSACNPGGISKPVQNKITVAAYYFPNYHTDDPRNIINKGPGWSEWELVKAAQPRFPGHHQPNIPAWGYTAGLNGLKVATWNRMPFMEWGI